MALRHRLQILQLARLEMISTQGWRAVVDSSFALLGLADVD